MKRRSGHLLFHGHSLDFLGGRAIAEVEVDVVVIVIVVRLLVVVSVAVMVGRRSIVESRGLMGSSLGNALGLGRCMGGSGRGLIIVIAATSQYVGTRGAGEMPDEGSGTDRSAKRSSSMFSGSVMMNRGAARVGGGATVVELGGSWAGRAASYRKGRKTSTGKEGKRRQTGPMRVAVVANIDAPAREARKKG